MQPHLDFGHGAAYEPRVSSPQLLKSLAQAALKDVKGSEEIIEAHFNHHKTIQADLLPPKPINLVMHQGYNSR